MHRLPCGLGCMLRGKRVFLRAHGPDLGPITHRPSKYHLLVFPQPAGEPQEYLCNWYTFFFFLMRSQFQIVFLMNTQLLRL